MLGFIVSPFAIAILAAWLVSRFPRRAGLLAAWPALLTVLLANEWRRAMSEGGRVVDLRWAPSLGLSLSFNLDGLGLLFATLIYVPCASVRKSRLFGPRPHGRP